MRIDSWQVLEQVLKEDSIEVIAFDMRGTLVEVPRAGNLERAAWRVGIRSRDISLVDKQIPQRVKEKYSDLSCTLDWTLVSVIEFASALNELGIPVSPAKTEQMLQSIIEEYISSASPLVTDKDFANLLRSITTLGIEAVLVCDGLIEREEKLLQKHLPLSFGLFSAIHASNTIGCNKLSVDYYKRVAEVSNASAAKLLVIGDRIDKDYKIPNAAGCKAILSTKGCSKDLYLRTIDLAKVCSHIGTKDLCEHGLVLGRFQPFHNEHIRLVKAASTRARELFVGVTNCFPSAIREAGGNRTSTTANPLPLWLRLQIIETTVRASLRNHQHVHVLPIPLNSDTIISAVPPRTTIFTTDIEPWSSEKLRILESTGLDVEVLELGDKMISGTKIRKLIVESNAEWRKMVPRAVHENFEQEVLSYVLKSSPTSR